MTPAQLKFTRFKSGPINRTIDTVLGIALIWWGSDFSSIAKDIGFVIGIFALLAGVLNVCWAAPIIGIPFRVKELTGGLDWWKRVIFEQHSRNPYFEISKHRDFHIKKSNILF